MGVRKHLCASSFRHLAAKREQAAGLRDFNCSVWSPGPLDMEDLVAMQIKLFDVAVLFVGIYLDSSVGVTGNNLKKLKTLAALTAGFMGPWMAVGDWNAEPAELRDSGWLEILQASVRTPTNI